MKATLEVTIKYTFRRIDIKNQSDSEAICAKLAKHFSESVDGSVYVGSTLCVPETEVAAGVTFVDLNW